MSSHSFFTSHLKFLPILYLSAETQLLSLVYFCFAGLDLLSGLSFADDKRRSIDWVYSLKTQYGFKGFYSDDEPHLTMTYCGLSTLVILGDDLSGIPLNDFIANIKKCQTTNGSFVPILGSTESDLRFMFSAVAALFLLGDDCWTGINKGNALGFIKSCKSYDGTLSRGLILRWLWSKSRSRVSWRLYLLRSG